MALYTTLLVGFRPFEIFRLNEILPFNNDESIQNGAQMVLNIANTSKILVLRHSRFLFVCYTVNNYTVGE